MQLSHTVMPSSSWYVPPVHGEHCDAPPVEKVPALQLVGVTLPVEQNAPAGHRSQSVPTAFLLVALAYRVAGHGSGVDAPSGQ